MSFSFCACRGGGTHNQSADGHVPAVEHPKGPRREPAVALLGGDGEHLLLEEPAEHGARVTLRDARHGDGQLQVLELVEADVDRVVEVVGEEEEGGRVFCSLSDPCRHVPRDGEEKDIPNRRLLMSAYAFLSAAVRHLGSSKLFARNRSVAPCSRFHVAMRHSPCRTVFFLSAR